MSKIIGRFLSAALVLCGLSMLFSPQTTQAQIAYQDAPVLGVTTGALTLNSTTFQVSATSANTVLVFIYLSCGNGSGGVDPGVPATVTWDGQTLTKAVSATSAASTYCDGAVYYLTNPPVATSAFTGSAIAPNGTTDDSWWLAYTITNVNTSIAPLTGHFGANTTGTNTAPVSGVAAGSWDALGYSLSSNGGVNNAGDESGGTVLTITNVVNGTRTGTAIMGSVSNCPAGNNVFFCYTSGGNKLAFVNAVFSAPAPPTIVTQPSSISANAEQDVTMTVGAAAASSYQWYVTNSSGLTPLPADNADHSGSQTATLTFLNISASDATNYVVVVTNNFGSVTSAVATLTFSAALPAFQLRMPFTNDLGNATTLSDTTGGALNITMNMTTNGVGPADLIGAPGTGVTNLNVNAQALDLATNTPWATANYNSGNTIAEPVANDINDTTLTNLGNNGIIGPFTVSFWMNQKMAYQGGGSSPRLWILNGGSTAQGENGSAANMAVYFNSMLQSSNQFIFTYGAGSVTLPGVVSANLPTNQWLFVAMTYDGTMFRMYYGTSTNAVVQIGSATLAGQSINLGSTACLSIGNRSTDFYRGLDGDIEDFRFYNVCAGSKLVEGIREALGVLSAPNIGNSVTNTVVSGSLWETSILSLSNAAAWSDPNGYPLTLSSVGPTSANGTNVTSDGTHIYYNGLVTTNDSFNYIISDGELTATGTVYLAVSSTQTAPSISNSSLTFNSNGNPTFSGNGIPGYVLGVESETNMSIGPWVEAGNVTVNLNGSWTFTDTNQDNPPTIFYRLYYPDNPSSPPQ